MSTSDEFKPAYITEPVTEKNSALEKIQAEQTEDQKQLQDTQARSIVHNIVEARRLLVTAHATAEVRYGKDTGPEGELRATLACLKASLWESLTAMGSPSCPRCGRPYAREVNRTSLKLCACGEIVPANP